MNASIAVDRVESIPGPRYGLGTVNSRWFSAPLELVAQLSGRQRVIAATALTGVLLAGAGIAAGAQMMAYVGVFALSVLANAVLFVPSGRGGIMVAAALTLNPLAVAILTGFGGAVGELTGYGLGRSSRKLLKKAKIPGWLSRHAERHTAVTILAISIIPNPFVDTVGIIAGRLGYPMHLFLAYSIVGKVIQSIALVYIALWNISLIGSGVGLG